jgi:hypothetical protein
MAKTIDTINVKIKINFTLWSAIKLRIAGMRTKFLMPIETQMDLYSIKGE